MKMVCERRGIIVFSPNVYTDFSEFSDYKYLSLKGLKPAASGFRDLDATTVPARRM